MGAPTTEAAEAEAPPPRRRGRRLITWVAIVLLGLPLLLAALGWLALRSGAVRRSILARISRSYEASTGIRARAADFSLQWRPGALALDDVTLATGDAAPFLTSASVRVEFDWGGLFGEPTTLKALVLERPVADLRQPLPPPSDEPLPLIDIRDLRLVDGRLLGEVAATGDEEPWLTAYDAAGVQVAGSYLESRAELRLDPARLTLTRAAGEPLALRIASRLAGPLEGPFRIDDLKLTGDGLRLDAAGELGTGNDDPLFLRLDLEADPAILVAELEPGARLTARGEIDLRTFRGELQAAATDFPSAALEPWIGEAARPGGRPSRLDLDARFTGDPAAARQVTGEGTLVWRQDERRLAEAALTLTDGRLDDAGVVLDSLVGDVHAEARDLPAELLRPFVDAELLARLAVRGTRFDLTADATVDAAAPAEPTGEVDLAWRRGREALVVASARTVDDPAGLAVAFEATLLPATPGRRRLAGRLAAASWPELAAGELRATRLELELPDVAAAVDDARERWPRLLGDVDLTALPVTLEGSLAAVAEAAGPIDAPRVTLDATWRPDDASSLVVAAGGEPLARRGEARLELAAIDLGRLAEELHGRVDGTVTARGEPADWSAEIDLRGTDLAYGTDMPAFERLRLEGETDGESLRITNLSGRTGESVFTGDGRVELPRALFGTEAAEAKVARAALDLDAEKPFSGIDRLAFRAALAGGVVHVERLDIETPNGPGELAAEVPLGALRAFELDVDAWPVVVADGRIMVDLGFPSLDLGNLALDVGQQPPWTAHEASLTGRVWIEPGDLTAAEGELLVERWLLEVEGHRLEVADDPILIALAGRKLEVVPVTLRADGRPVDVKATVDLTPGWTPDDGFAALVAAVDAHAEGVLEGQLFTPYLAGGVGDGPVAVTADVSGTLDDLDVHVVADGPDARVLYMTPYVTQLEAFHLEVIVDGDEIRLPEARARLNRGLLRADARRSAAGDWTFNARFDDVRYRVDYGLSTQLDGRLELALPAEGNGRLAGEVVVERGVLRRDVDLQREILAVLNAPPDVAGVRDDPLAAIELDLTITTAEGVRIKNNLADLKADWSTLTVQGTLANPAIEGRIEAAPGGRVTIFGRTAPSDQVALVFTGEPGAPPELELPTLTAFHATQKRDPSAPRGPFEWQSTVEYEHLFGSGGGDPVAKEKQLGLGLASYYGGQIAERISERLGTVRIQPVLVFTESDPAAKIVISNDLSRNVALAAAIDLRDSQEQTYLLDLHDFRGLPRFTFQVFTNEEDNEGGTLEHTLLFGGGKRDEGQVRLRKIRLDGLPEELSARRVRNAVGYTRNEPLPEGVDFDIEVEVAEQLRQRGYPDAEVNARVEPVKDRADLVVRVEPGQHVVFEFEGDKPPVALRRSITASYRSDFYEPAALAEIRARTVQALRGLGYLEPAVEVGVEPATAETSRTVRIRGEGGRRVRIGHVAFAGVDDATATLLRGRLGGEAARVELAAGQPEADAWLLTQMRSLGYPAAEIVSRWLADDGRELSVTLAPGPRQEIASVAITGLNDDDRARYARQLPLAAGDVPRSDRVSAGKYLIQNDLKRQGHAEARVRSVLDPIAEGSQRLDLVYEVDPGPLYRLDAVKFEGLQATRPRWAEKVTRLEQDAPLEPSRVAEARRRLLGTRLFTSVRSTSDRFPDSSTSIVTFDVDEIPRYRLAYGLRWESSEGGSLVVDAVDRNFFGRGMTLGLRGLYSADDQAGRFYVAKSGIFGRRMALEYYLEQRHLEEDATPDDPVENIIVTDSVESSVQVSFPIRRLTSRVYGRFRREHIREKEPLDPFFPFDVTVRFPFAGWQVIYDTRDDLINPLRGTFVSADLSASGDYIGSDFDFVRLFTQLHWHRPAFPVGRRQLTWSQAYRVGLFGSRDGCPLGSEQFTAGGEYSVRGYPNESLVTSPDPCRPQAVGEALLVINQELRFPIWNVLSGVVFVDAGNAWGDMGDFGSDLFTSTGFGLRADTPFGLFRLDLARPLDRREGDPEYKVYVGFGHAF